MIIEDTSDASEKSFDESELDQLEAINPTAAVKICNFILKHEKKADLALALVDQHQETLVDHLILPLLEKDKLALLNLSILNQLSAKNVKSALESLAKVTKPDWTILLNLNLDLQDNQVQTHLASIVIKQGLSKDLKLGKFVLGLLKTMPKLVQPIVYDLWSQAVSMHQSFLSKACQAELNKMSVE